MGRNNAEPRIYYHASPVDNRSSIEKNGLLPDYSKNSYENNSGRSVYRRAVFVGRTQNFMAGVADHLALNNHYGAKKSDIWEVRTMQEPKPDVTWDGASMFTKKIPAKSIKRIGHITETGEVHWHPEEECPNG